MRLLERERPFGSALLVQVWETDAKCREFAMLGEEMIAASIERGTLTERDRSEALALASLRGVHWRLTRAEPL